MNLVDQLIKHEGSVIKNGRHKLYRCSEGKNTICYGRNLDANGVSEDEARLMLMNDIENARADCGWHILFYQDLDPVRQDALTNMCFNIGINRLLGFKKMLKAMEEGNWQEARKQALDSRWAVQVKGRSLDIAHMIETGTYP